MKLGIKGFTDEKIMYITDDSKTIFWVWLYRDFLHVQSHIQSEIAINKWVDKWL